MCPSTTQAEDAAHSLWNNPAVGVLGSNRRGPHTFLNAGVIEPAFLPRQAGQAWGEGHFWSWDAPQKQTGRLRLRKKKRKNACELLTL